MFEGPGSDVKHLSEIIEEKSHFYTVLKEDVLEVINNV